MSESGIELRQLTPADGPAIAALGDQTPETGAIAFHTVYRHDPYADLLALKPGTMGVGAVAAGHEGFVGLGLMTLGEFWYEGAVRPSAYLYSLSVHPDFRRRGIASQIALWRLEQARARFGDEGVVLAGVQAGNEGSMRTAAKWSSQRFDGRTSVSVVGVRSAPPRPLGGVEVRPAAEGELEEFAGRVNRAYGEHNFYPPKTAEALRAWLAEEPFGERLHECWVAADSRGNLLAGLCLTDEGCLIAAKMVNLMWPLRLVNRLVHLIPADGLMRRLTASDFWHEPGRQDAGAYLWQSIRWLGRERGSALMLFYDTRDPIGRVARAPFLMGTGGGALFLRGPVPAREDRLMYLQGV